MKKLYTNLVSEITLYPGMAGWHFLSIPKGESEEIKKHFGKAKRGWGSIPVNSTLGKSVWDSSIFPDKKSGTYLLPLKASIRMAEGVRAKDIVSFQIKIRL